MIGPLGAFRRGTPCHVTATSRRTVVGWGRIVRMTPTIVARYDQDALEIATLDGQTCRTVGVHITVECPVDSTAAGHAALDAAVAEVRRQLDMLGPSRSRVVLVDGPEAQDARG